MTPFERDVHLAAERGEPIPAADVLRLLATIDTLRGELVAETKGRYVPPGDDDAGDPAEWEIEQ